ncbi:DUF6973 domain-containing protein [Paracoccus sediminicola]|uniref:DUF6973 domain-containing protein n=1 Tax=Paracoccus sediminicola TaxID=3017783 RepID=UPI0022F0F5FD|nr:LysM peptidoglycan-binding domain-containing protein [Paracoccus sediminicola]WBU57172.1 LysM peptidoglycan-binding domain-containing protein [Paracoccus sediminicola]
MFVLGLRPQQIADRITALPRQFAPKPEPKSSERNGGCTDLPEVKLPDTGSGRRGGEPPVKVEPLGDGTGSGIVDAAKGAKDGVLIAEGVDGLNGEGDSAYLRMTPAIGAAGNLRVAELGGEAMLGADMRVTQNGEGDDATYTLRYEKHALAGATGKMGTDTLGRGRADKTGEDLPVDAAGKAALSGQSFDAVEMTFDSKEDAIRAAETLQRLTLADAAGDVFGATGPGLGPIGIATGSGGNPLANPLNGDGAPGPLAQRLAGVSAEDMAHLEENITAYESTFGGRQRLALELGGDVKHFDAAVEGRVDPTQRITRRVELATDTQAGSLSYTMRAGVDVTGSQKLKKGFEAQGAGIGGRVANLKDLASASTEVTLNYELPANTDPTRSPGGRPVPEYDALTGKGDLELDSVQLRQEAEFSAQSLHDPSRTDLRRLSAEVTLNDPDQIKTAMSRLRDGDFEGAAAASGAEVELNSQEISRSGVDTVSGVSFDFGIGNVDASVIFESGVDEITAEHSLTVSAGHPKAVAEGLPGGMARSTGATRIPPGPEDDGKTFVVTPWSGAAMRDAPGGAQDTVIQSGSFLRDTGDRGTDAAGNDFIKVSGTDVNDRPVEGWVAADILAPHSSATGAMDATGRTNPSLEHQRYDAVTVENDDNLWDLAKQYGADPQEMVALNRDHLQNPSLIFKGDTVYMPGTSRGPEPETIAQPATPPAASSPLAPERATSERSGSPGSEVPTNPEPTSGAEPGRVSDDETSPDLPSGSGAQPVPPGYPGSASSPQPSPGPVYGPQNPAPTASEAPAETDPAAPSPAPAAGPGDAGGRADLDRILQEYQVREDQMVEEYRPKFAGVEISVFPAQRVTRAEADLLDRLSAFELKDMKDIKDAAYARADAQIPQTGADGMPVAGGNDGHNDAFRHAYWNATMTSRFGEDYAASFATAHEGVPNNQADREAMDLYNNEVGRRIAVENPDATADELADLVYAALENGELLVIDGQNELAYSDQVAIGATGIADDAPHFGGNAPPQLDDATS